MADFPNEIRINPAVMNKLILGGVGVVLVGMGLMSSFYKVNPGEHAIVLTLGRYIGKPVTEEGLKFNWPFGIDRVTKVNVAELRTAVFGFDETSARPRTEAQRKTAEIVTGDLEWLRSPFHAHMTSIIGTLSIFLVGLGASQVFGRKSD